MWLWRKLPSLNGIIRFILANGFSVDITQNYFDLFQLPHQYQIDTKALKLAYRQLQRELHPDRFAGGTDQEKRLAVQYSTFVNQAYDALLSPVKRGEYMLSLQGVERDAAQTIKNDPQFLMEQMMWREKLELIESKGDEDALDAFKDQVEVAQSKIENELADKLLSDALDNAMTLIGKLQFTEKMLMEIDELEERFLD